MSDRHRDRNRQRQDAEREPPGRQVPVRPAFAAPGPGPSSPAPPPASPVPPPLPAYPPPAYPGAPSAPAPGPPAAYPTPPPYPGTYGVPPAPSSMPAPGGLPPTGAIPASPWAYAPGTWTPRADVYQEDGDYVIITDVPGIDLDTLDLTWDGGELVLEATIRSPEKPERKPVVRERPSGSYYRRIPLGPDLDPTGAVASYCDGILEVRVPRKRRRMRRAVRVSRPDQQPT